MPTIPLYQRQAQPSRQTYERNVMRPARIPETSVAAAAAPWEAAQKIARGIGDVGQVIGDIGEARDARDREAKKLALAYADKKQKARDKVDVARAINELESNWAAKQSVLKNSDNENAIQSDYEEWEQERWDVLNKLEVSDAARTEIATHYMKRLPLTRNLTLGAGGYRDLAETANMDKHWVKIQEGALDGVGLADSTPAETYYAAIDARLDLGTLTPEQGAKMKRTYGQTAYYRWANKEMSINYEAYKENVDYSRMSPEQQIMVEQRERETQKRIDDSIEDIHDSTFSSLQASANSNELSLSQIEAAQQSEVSGYAGATTQALSKDKARVLKAIVMTTKAGEQNSRDYIRVWDAISENLDDGKIMSADIDRVFKRMVKTNGKPLFSSETNLELVNQTSNLFGVGKKYNPEGLARTYEMTEVHAGAIRDVNAAFNQNLSLVGNEIALNAVAGRYRSLMNLFEEKKKDLTKADVEEWKKNEMFDVNVENAQNASRSAVTQRMVVRKNIENGRVVAVQYDDGTIEEFE